MRISAIVLAISVMTCPALTAQDTRPIPIFPAQADAVRLSVSVTTQVPAPLTVGDFTIYEDGLKQVPTFFSKQSMPMDLILLLDLSDSMMETFVNESPHLKDGVVQSIRQFVDLLGPDDRMQVMAFHKVVMTLQDFTGDRKLLRNSLKDPQPALATALWDALCISLNEFGNLPQDAASRRRHVLVVITDGMENASHVSKKTLEDTVRKTPAAIYVLAFSPTLTADTYPAYSESRFLLNKICRESGGVLSESPVAEGLTDIARHISTELKAEYTLGWVTDTRAARKPWRTIQVAIRGVPSEHVRYRSGYLVPR